MDCLKIEAAGTSKMLVPVNQTMCITPQTIILIFTVIITCFLRLVLKGLIKYASWHLKMVVASSSVMIHIEQIAWYHISKDYNFNPRYTHIYVACMQISGLRFSFFSLFFTPHTEYTLKV